ncbi:MAG: hydrogenase maturation protease [Candidatus Hydrogenedens sp.]|nr:hydrogenase maturation protease [Candidatus Hydrogenedens sp.]
MTIAEVSPVPVLIIGVGNRFRRDDGVGPWVVDRLRQQGIPALEHSGEGAGLLDLWSEAEAVMIIDAARSGAPPGTVHCLDAVANKLPNDLLRPSTHLFGVAEAIETARVLGRLPATLVLYAIEGSEFGFGEVLSPAVERAAGDVIAAISESLDFT